MENAWTVWGSMAHLGLSDTMHPKLIYGRGMYSQDPDTNSQICAGCSPTIVSVRCARKGVFIDQSGVVVNGLTVVSPCVTGSELIIVDDVVNRGSINTSPDEKLLHRV